MQEAVARRCRPLGLQFLLKEAAVLDSFSDTGNRVIKLIQLDERQAREESGRLHSLAETIESFLERHLADEEELAVPIILHHRLRG